MRRRPCGTGAPVGFSGAARPDWGIGTLLAPVTATHRMPFGGLTMFRSILVPLDGTKFGEHALPLAAELARRCDATLHLAQVITPVIVGDNLAQYAVIESESTEDVSA